MSSNSSQGTSVITIQFDLNRNIDAAALDVQTALTIAQRRLPIEMTISTEFPQGEAGRLPGAVRFARLGDTAAVGRQRIWRHHHRAGAVAASGRGAGPDLRCAEIRHQGPGCSIAAAMAAGSAPVSASASAARRRPGRRASAGGSRARRGARRPARRPRRRACVGRGRGGLRARGDRRAAGSFAGLQLGEIPDPLLALGDDLAGDLAGRPECLEGADDLADEERLEAERALVARPGRRVDPLPTPR